MKSLLIAAIFAGAALTNVASADPLICHEPWYTPQPHAPHPMPCHAQGGQVQGHPRDSHGPTRVPSANPAAPSDTDFGCGFYAASDPNPEAPANTMTGYMDGGAIVQSGTITCTIQVGGDTHDDANNGASASATGTNGVTYLSPTLMSYTSPPLTPVYLCTQFNDGSTTYYWDNTTATWTTSSTSNCALSIGVGGDDPALHPVFDLLETLQEPVAGLARDVGDPVACPVLASLQGDYGVTTINSQGDVFFAGEAFWDCPPYDLSS